jgi:hypothetical protein
MSKNYSKDEYKNATSELEENETMDDTMDETEDEDEYGTNLISHQLQFI